jgi:hypothetical protein
VQVYRGLDIGSNKPSFEEPLGSGQRRGGGGFKKGPTGIGTPIGTQKLAGVRDTWGAAAYMGLLREGLQGQTWTPGRGPSGPLQARSGQTLPLEAPQGPSTRAALASPVVIPPVSLPRDPAAPGTRAPPLGPGGALNPRRV